MKSSVLNGVLRNKSLFESSDFRNMLLPLYNDDSVAESFLGGKILNNGSILAAFLNIPQSPLCGALLRNPASPFSHLHAAMQEEGKMINSKPKILDFLTKFFNDPSVIKQIQESFRMVVELREFKFPSITGMWGKFNFLQINELRKQPASPHTLVDAAIQLLPKYVAFYVNFLTSNPNIKPQHFYALMFYLDVQTLHTNELWRVLLLKQNSCFARFILDNFQRLINEPNPSIFAAEYISIFLNETHSNELASFGKEFNSIEKLDGILYTVDALLYSDIIHKQDYEDDYLLKLRFFDLFTWRAIFCPATLVEILSTLSTYKVTPLGLKNPKDKFNQSLNSLNTILQIIFKDYFDGEKQKPVDFYLKSCLISSYLSCNCPSIMDKSQKLETRIHQFLDFTLAPFKEKDILKIQRIILTRYLTLRIFIDTHDRSELRQHTFAEEFGVQVPFTRSMLEGQIMFLQNKLSHENKK